MRQKQGITTVVATMSLLLPAFRTTLWTEGINNDDSEPSANYRFKNRR